MDEIVLVKHELQVPKETKEVIDFLAAIAEKVIAKAATSEYMQLVDELYKGLEGVEKVGAEVKGNHKGAIVAYLVDQVGKKL